MGCVVAKEVIAVLHEGNWIDRGDAVRVFYMEESKRLVEKYAVLSEARVMGLLLGLEFRSHKRISAELVYHALLEKGFSVGYYPAGNVLRFDPPLTVEKDDVTYLVDCIDAILENMG